MTSEQGQGLSSASIPVPLPPCSLSTSRCRPGVVAVFHPWLPPAPSAHLPSQLCQPHLAPPCPVGIGPALPVLPSQETAAGWGWGCGRRQSCPGCVPFSALLGRSGLGLL